MYNCFTCRYAREKFVNTDNEKMLFYCEKHEVMLVALNQPEYTCDEYDDLHDYNAARQDPKTRNNGIHKEE